LRRDPVTALEAPEDPMPRTRPLLLALCALSGLLALPAVALAAGPVAVSGAVTGADTSPAAGVEVTVMVDGSDTVQATTTDGTGSFAVEVTAEVGDTLEIRATGPTVRTGPDEDGCTTSTTPSGRVTLAIEALPLDPVAVVMDTVIEDRVCAATATPGQPTTRPHPRPTPPPTDGIDRPAGRHRGWLAIVAGLACLSSGLLLAARRRVRDGRGDRRP
jgi:hypothetical protein